MLVFRSIVWIYCNNWSTRLDLISDVPFEIQYLGSFRLEQNEVSVLINSISDTSSKIWGSTLRVWLVGWLVGCFLWHINDYRLFNTLSSLYTYIKYDLLVGFYGISTIVDYLMPNIHWFGFMVYQPMLVI